MAVMMKQRLIDLRVEAGFRSQDAFAKAVGIGKSTIWKAENQIEISRTSALLIAKTLRANGVQVTIDDIDWRVGSS